MDLGTMPPAATEITDLVERLRSGRCVLCAGSRLTAADGERSFRTLVGKLLAALPDGDADGAREVLESRPLAAAGFVRRRLGDRFAEELRKAAAPFAELPEAVRLLGELPFRAVVTTTWDDAFERAFIRDGVMPRIYTPRDAEALKNDGKLRFVFKALGDPSRADSIVWSSEDLQTALADGGYRTVAHDLYRSRSFLFVGFHGSDPDLAMLLERVLAGARAGDVDHFAVIPGLGAVEKEELYAAYHIRVLSSENVAELARQLKEDIGDAVGPTLPDDDDFEGWLGLLADDGAAASGAPGRAEIDDRLDALTRKLRGLGDWESLIDLMLGRVGVEPSVERRAEMLLEVARTFEHEVGDLSKAFTALVAAYKEHPRVEAWQELERLAQATGMWSELCAELAEVMPTLPDGERAQAWLRIARLYGDKLNAAEYALSALDQALALQPSLEDASELRVTLYKRLERWSDLAEALSAAGRFIEQAEVLEAHLGDATQAAAAYRRALQKDPLQHDARAALETLLRRSGEWRALAALLDERVPYATVEEARALKAEAAALFADRLDDRKQALVRYEALAAEDPRDLTVLRALERLYSADGQEAQYIECLGRQAEAVESDRERAALYRRMASLWEEIPGSSARAEECLEKLLAVDPRAEDALRSLERLYYAERKWSELIDACRRHAALVPPPNAGEIHFQIAAIYEHELRALDQAIDAYLEVETLLPNHGDTMEALTRVYQKTGQWQKAADVLERRAQLAEVKSQRLELHYQAGEIYAEKLGESKQAESRFVRALEIDPTHVPAMTALVEIYRKNGDFLKAAKLLVEAVPHTPNRLERTRLLVEAGEIYDGLDDQRKATELYLDALGVDPEHVEAGERVAELLWKGERYADLVPVLEMLTRKEAEPGVQVERLTRLAHAAHALGLDDKVGKAYARAAELDETHLEAQRGRAAWHYRRAEWQEARAALEKVFQHHVEDLPPSERVELLYELGSCELELGEQVKAKELIAKALELDPAHRPSLLVSLELGEAKPESLIDAKKALLVTATGVEEQARLLGEIGDVWLEKLANRDEAISAWREGLELKGDDHKLLHKCLDAYVEDKAWPQALEMLERLIEFEKVQSVRAKYRHAAGLICRDELGRAGDAAAHLSAALDDDPSLERSSEALEELLVARQEWKELARFYRKQLKRIGAESPGDSDGKNGERLRVWSALGALCLEQLGERESALAALEVALTFDRGNLERHKQLADLYVQAGPDKFDKSILEHQLILRSEKSRVLSYRALKHLYIQTGQREKSVQLSVALCFLKKGEPDDLTKANTYKHQAMAIARRPLTDEMWMRLVHPDEDRYLGALFALVAPMLAAATAQPHKALGLNRKEALSIDDPRSFGKALKYVTTTLGVAPPEAYVRADQKEAVAFANCVDGRTLVPVFSLGAPLVGDKRQEREQVFELARRAAHLRPERFVRFILPQPQQLGHLVEAAMVLGESGADKTPTGQGASETGKTVQSLRRALQPVQLENVAAIGRKLRADGVKPDEAALKWLQASDLTAIRAGFVMTGDLETSARLIAAEPQPATALPATQRLLDLVWSSVTEELFSVRKQLGML